MGASRSLIESIYRNLDLIVNSPILSDGDLVLHFGATAL